MVNLLNNDIELIKKYVSKEEFQQALKRLEDGEPVQYIIGNVEFYNSIIDVNKKDCGEEDEIIFEASEMVNKITIWKDESFRGFEIKTNKKREKKFGWCGEGTRVELEEFDCGINYLVGFYLGFQKNVGILNMGFYYINKKSFYLLLNLGIFFLRITVKKEEFKKKN